MRHSIIERWISTKEAINAERRRWRTIMADAATSIEEDCGEKPGGRWSFQSLPGWAPLTITIDGASVCLEGQWGEPPEVRSRWRGRLSYWQAILDIYRSHSDTELEAMVLSTMDT